MIVINVQDISKIQILLHFLKVIFEILKIFINGGVLITCPGRTKDPMKNSNVLDVY